MHVPDPLPADVAACHALIQQMQAELIETRRKLAIHEENERVRMEHLYGKGATAEKLLNFGRMIAGKKNVRALSNPDDPTCGELYLRAKAAERAKRRKKK